MYTGPPPERVSDLLEVLRLLPVYIVDKLKLSDDMAAVKAEITAYQLFAATCTGTDEDAINIMGQETWWAVIGLNKFPTLAVAARVLFTIPTSQAESERVWSLYDFIHTKRRNRLSAAKASGLVIMYANARLRENEVNMVDVLRGFAEDYDEYASGSDPEVEEVEEDESGDDDEFSQ